MMKSSPENIVQTETGDTISISVGCGDCCESKFLVSMFGNSPRTYHQGKFTKDEAVIERLTK